MKLKGLHLEFQNKKLDTITPAEIKRLSEYLKRTELSELKTDKYFVVFLDLVKKVREWEVLAQGERLRKLLEGMLAVGDDGAYAGSDRYFFELIQNVDDCEFAGKEKELDIEFNPPKGTVTLTYNEIGFTPKDVFCITGIAEESKNISADKVEIGEKGIGFKTVFGIADEVLIQSGKFSFALKKGSFTIPQPRFDGYYKTSGTKLTLFINGGGREVERIYRSLAERYKSENTLINENPIIFLNRLTKIRMFIDGFRQIIFRKDPVSFSQIGNGVEFDENVTISADFKDYHNGAEKNHSKSIQCFQYSKDIIYSRDACISRYGEKTPFGEAVPKVMRLSLLFPHIDELDNVTKGSLYSFLPTTQTRTTAPIIIHAPFKLASTRESVDAEKNNAWFKETIKGLSELFVDAYKHLATQVKNSIARYLPNQKWLFDGIGESDKVSCLRIREFSRELLLDEKLFICSDGEYRIAKEVCAISSSDKIKDVEAAHSLAGIVKPLFIAETTKKFDDIGIAVHEKVKDTIFFRALEDERISRGAFDFLLVEEYKPDDETIKQRLKKVRFTIHSLKILSGYIDYKKVIENVLVTAAKDSFDSLPSIELINEMESLEPKHEQLVNGALGEIERKIRLKDYWEKIKGKCFYYKCNTADFYFPTQSFLLLFGESPLQVLEGFARSLGGSRLFEVALTTCAVSEQLDRLCDNNAVDYETFFDRLKEQRNLLRRSFGTEAYGAYIKIIQDAGANPNRFLKELIQNSDDCEYEQNSKPQLTITISKQQIISECNERGFTRKNLRAITAIGESTKKRLFGNAGTIGEKGIGFKAVFGIAERVVIRSCRDSERFDFSLTAATPTIPKKESDKGFEHLTGTRMDFYLKEPVPVSPFDENEIIDICRCLRKLRHIEIGDIIVEIKDNYDGTERLITIKKGHLSTKTIKLRIVRHDFKVDDEQAIAERTDNHSIAINNQQKVIVYIPEKSTDNKGGTFPLYSGLPTNEMVNAPLYIDAPFELTASREHIHKNRWNEYIAGEVLVAVSKALIVIAKDERKGVLDYIPKDGELFSGKFAEGIDVDFESAARQFKFLPTLDEEYFAETFSGLTYYPNFVRLLLEKMKIHEIDNKKTLDFFLTLSSNTERYLGILGYLQCKLADDGKILDIIEKYAPEYMNDTNIRGAVYSYLKNIQQQTKQGFLHRIKQLKIIPVKSPVHDKPIFTSFDSKPTWYGYSEKSTSNYNILFIEWLPKDDYNKIFDAYIQEMNDGERRIAYEKKLDEIFKKADRKKEYEWLRNEFQNNRGELQRSQGWFLLNKSKVPLLTAVGSFCYASSSLFKADASVYDRIQGKHLKLFLVSKECLSLADFLGLPMIEKISFSEYSDYEEIKLTREDVLDLQNMAIVSHHDGIAILAQCKDAGYISDTLISEMNLDGLGDSKIDEKEYKFPIRPVANINRLRERVIRLWNDEPIKVITREVTTRERVGETIDRNIIPIIGEDSNNYAKEMYSAVRASTGHADPNTICCQLCQKPYPHRYIEVNKVEYLPNFYWEQLKLSFCLNCSKDFEMLRNNLQIGNAFVEAIINNEVESETDGTVKVRIGDKQISFTATHFAEVQQILRVMKHNEDTKAAKK